MCLRKEEPKGEKGWVRPAKQISGTKEKNRFLENSRRRRKGQKKKLRVPDERTSGAGNHRMATGTGVERKKKDGISSNITSGKKKG